MAVEKYQYRMRIFPEGGSEEEYAELWGGWIEFDPTALNDSTRKLIKILTERLEDPAEQELEAAWNRGAPGDRSEYLSLLEAP